MSESNGESVKRVLLDHVVCPGDGLPLGLDAAETRGEEILEGTLRCDGGHEYPVTRGVPRLLSPEVLEAGAKATQQSFSAKWRRIPDFGHEAASRKFYIDWYLRRYGFGDIDGLRDFLSGRRKILDAGTGLGRDALLYGENSEAEVFALDLSASVDLAYQHTEHLPNVHVIQGDLTRLPFPKRFFDFVASDQVLHHTPDTRISFRYLAEFLQPRAEIVAYVYKRKAPVREFSDDFLRDHYTEASEEECYAFSRAITALGKALSDLEIEFEVPEDVPILGIKAGRHDLQRFIYWHFLKCYWNDGLDFETNVMTNFDWYHPKYAHRHTPEEVLTWCEESSLEIVHFDVVESGISVRARAGDDPG